MITTTPKLEKSVERFFEKHEKIEVSFEPQDITVKDQTARVILQQSTHLIPKRGRPQDQRPTLSRSVWGV